MLQSPCQNPGADVGYHSGARQGREPGIHSTSHVAARWIPAPAFRAALETELLRGGIVDRSMRVAGLRLQPLARPAPWPTRVSAVSLISVSNAAAVMASSEQAMTNMTNRSRRDAASDIDFDGPCF